MRILSVTQSYDPFLEFGGPPVKVRALARGLAKHGNQSTVLTADWGLAARMKKEAAARTERCKYGWRRTENGVTAIYLPAWLRYRSVTWNPGVRRFCRERLQDFDVMHIYGLYDLLGPAVSGACLRRNIPYVLEPMGMFVPIVRNLRLKKIYHLCFGQRMLRGAGAIIATSEQEAEELAGAGVSQEKIVLRRNGVERPEVWPLRGFFRQKLGIPEETRIVLFLGRLSEKKSPDLLLRAFVSIVRTRNDKTLRLVYAGPDEGGMKVRLERMAEQLGVAPQVHFTGPIFGETKWAAYRDAEVFVLPSQNENFGNAAAESVAAGTPVVVTERCGIAPLLANLAGTVVPYDSEALADAIKPLLNDSALRARLSAGCAAVTARLGWEEPLREMTTLYNKLAYAHRRGAEFDVLE